MKLFILLLTLIISFSTFAAPKQLVEIVTYDVLVPFAYRNSEGKLTGIYIEIVKKAISRMPDYKLNFNVLPWARAKAKVKKGDAFAILPPYFHAHDGLKDKKPYILPYSLSLFTLEDVVICNKKFTTRFFSKWPEDFAGLKFAMWKGDGRAGESFNKMVKEKKLPYIN